MDIHLSRKLYMTEGEVFLLPITSFPRHYEPCFPPPLLSLGIKSLFTVIKTKALHKVNKGHYVFYFKIKATFMNR